MDEFFVLKFFGINTRLGKVFVHVQVCWNFFVVGWTKVNINSVIWRSPSPIAHASIFKGSCRKYIGDFYAFLGNQNVLYAEVTGAFLPLKMLKGLSLKNFDWRVSLLCSIKLCLMLKWLLGLLEGGGEGVYTFF